MTRLSGDQQSDVGTHWAPSDGANGDGHRDGSDHGPDHGQHETAHCRRCDADVRPDAGRCPECRSFLPGNRGGEAVKRDRQRAGQELMTSLRQELVEDAGGEANLTGAERLLIEQAVRLEVVGRTLAGDAVKKGVGSDAGRQSLHAWLACLDRQARALNLLGTDRRAEVVDPYEAIEAAVIEANRDDEGDRDAGESQPTDNGGGPTPDPDDDGREAAAQALDNGNPPADVMAYILDAAGVRA